MVARSPLVLYVDDEPNNLELLKLQFEGVFRLTVASNAEEALAILAAQDVWVLLTDERMPGMTGIDLLETAVLKWPDTRRIIVSAYSDVVRVLQAINRGHAHEYVLKPWNKKELGACIERNLEVASQRRRLTAQLGTASVLAAQAAEGYDPDHIVGAESGLKQVVALAGRAAQKEAPVLLVGETGTGKELVARFIHRSCARAAAPFIRATSAALTESALAPALFNHGGTLFLDEIGDLPPPAQAVLLRSLQGHPFNVRLIAATRQSLPRLVAEGRLRQDLYYLLEVVIVQLPPLRERAQDIPALLEHFIRQEGPPRSIAKDALANLCTCLWPGNVRELRNMVQRALINSEGGELTAEDFTFNIDFPAVPSIREEAQEAEKEVFRRALVAHGGNVSAAARALGIPRTTFYSKAKKYGLIP